MNTAFTTICEPGVMGDQDQCCTKLCVELEDQVNNMLTSRRIQVSCWFVCEQNLDRGSKCACNCYPLLFTTGELARVMIQPVTEANSIK